MLNSALFPSHEFLDFIMVADKEKDNLVSEFKENAVFESGADFPVVAMPVFEAKARRKWGFAIQIVHESVNGLINLLSAGGGEFLEAAIKAGFKFVLHFISSAVLSACEQPRSPHSGCRALSLTDQAWQPAFCNHRR